MSARPRLQLKRVDLVWILLSLIVLLPIIFYLYVNTFDTPDFSLDPRDWRVLEAPRCAAADCLQVGDQVLALGKLDLATFSSSRAIELLAGFDDHGTAMARVLRHGQVLSFPVQARGRPGLGWTSLMGLLPIVFWLMGTATIIFLRPRDERWLVLVAFAYVNALWLASGLASASHLRGSAIVFHAVIWLFLPLALHLHLILPSSLLGRRLRRAILLALYAAALALVVVDGRGLLHSLSSGLASGPILFTAAGVLASLALLLVRLFLPLDTAVKLADRIMLFGLLFGLGPFVACFGLIPLLGSYLPSALPHLWTLYPWLTAISLLSVPMLPMSYIYAIYKHHLGALEFRANRLLGVYGFSALAITAYAVALVLVSGRQGAPDERSLAVVFAVSLAFAAGVPLLRAPFQRLIDRQVFGLRHAPEEIIDLVSERIPLAFDRAVLAQLLVGEILPTLLIRQSVL
jgi:hypothetical protein